MADLNIKFVEIKSPNFFRIKLAVCLIFILSAFAFGQVGKIEPGRVIEVKINAPSLAGNLLGDPTEQSVSIYLPPGYQTSPKRRYPVLYLLHGFGGSNRTWTTDAPYSFKFPPILDAMIAGGKAREMIIVAPNGSNAYHGSFYLNSEVTGNWEDYIFKDVVGYVDKNYRTLARASSRGIAGHSMGGFGAVSVGMKHADVFSVIYAISPAPLGHEEPTENLFPIWKLLGSYKSRDQLKGDFNSTENFYENVLVALSAAFSPNPAKPPFFADFPYDERDGKIYLNETIAAKWRGKTPLYLIDQYKQNLFSLRGLVIDYGRSDEVLSVSYNSALFSKALADRGIPHIFEIYDGTHEDKVKKRLETHVFPYFSEKLDFTNP